MPSSKFTLAPGLVHSRSSGEGGTKRERKKTNRTTSAAEQQNCFFCCGNLGLRFYWSFTDPSWPQGRLYSACAFCLRQEWALPGINHALWTRWWDLLNTCKGQTRYQQKPASNQSWSNINIPLPPQPLSKRRQCLVTCLDFKLAASRIHSTYVQNKKEVPKILWPIFCKSISRSSEFKI